MTNKELKDKIESLTTLGSTPSLLKQVLHELSEGTSDKKELKHKINKIKVFSSTPGLVKDILYKLADNAPIKPTPEPAPPTPAYEYVDLGLPSGLKWAKCNVGAENEYDTGLYFALGETEGYAGDAGHNFNWANYKWSIDGSSSSFSKYNTTGATLELEDDAARANLGGSWRMPTAAEIDELINNTTRTWTTNYEGTGKAGYIVKSKTNSNQIFMPAAGYSNGANLGDFGLCGYYRSSSQDSNYLSFGCDLYFNRANFFRASRLRCYGLSVRGVCE